MGHRIGRIARQRLVRCRHYRRPGTLVVIRARHHGVRFVVTWIEAKRLQELPNRFVGISQLQHHGRVLHPRIYRTRLQLHGRCERLQTSVLIAGELSGKTEVVRRLRVRGIVGQRPFEQCHGPCNILLGL
jgi:hypothetical protein